jgi:hypothetical protein
MSEESQLDAMRAAIRGDFERLAERRGEQELMRIDESRPPAEPEPLLEQEPPPEPELPPELELELEPELQPEPEPTEAEAPPRRSWLDRLLGR